MTIFDIESIYVQDGKFKDTETTTWIGKRIPKSVLILSNLIQPVFLCDPYPQDLVSSFTNALENLVTQSKVQVEMNFP